MAERCVADVEYEMTWQGQGFVIDEFGRKIKPPPPWWSSFMVADATFGARISCGLCRFRSAKVGANGKTKREAFDIVRGKVQQFLLDYCESGKNLI